MLDDEWIYLSNEHAFLKARKQDGIEFKTFDEFWNTFNKNSFLIPPDDVSFEIEKFKNKLKANALEIYNTFKGK